METLACQRCLGTGILQNQEALGNTLREERKRRGFSQGEVAVKMGCSVSFVSELELGKRYWTLKLVKSFKEALQ